MPSDGEVSATEMGIAPAESAPGSPPPDVPLGLETITITELEVTGMCCQSEADLITKKLGRMKGVSDLTFNMMLRRVAVKHDPELAPAEKLVRALNWSLLGASIADSNSKGGGSGLKRQPARREAALALVTFVLFVGSSNIWNRPAGVEWWDDPSSWSAISCAVVVMPVLAMRALAGVVYSRSLNMFCTMLIASVGALALADFWEAAAISFFFSLSEWIQARPPNGLPRLPPMPPLRSPRPA